MPVTTDRVQKTPHVRGGDACIVGHWIPVWGLVAARRLGSSNDDLLRSYLSLAAADLDAAWEYATVDGDEIEIAIRENERGS